MDELETALGGDLRAVVECASLAPSVHNSQPWRFTWDGRALTVHEDVERALPVLDPQGRERLLSCGAAVLQARIAFAARGYDVRLDLLPDDADPQRVATLTVQGRCAPDEQDTVLAAAIPRRATDRDPFDRRPVPGPLRAALAAAAETEGAWGRFVDEAADGAAAVELQVLLSHADDSQRRDPSYLAELAAWRREREGEGVPADALPSVPGELRGSSWALRDYAAGDPATGDTAAGDAAAAGPPPEPEHPAVLVLGTTGDTRRDWVVAGQALGRVLLVATASGLAAQPLTQVLEVPVLRARMRHALGGVGHPQMLLRIGFGSHDATTGRRPVSETLTLVDPS